MMYELQSKKRMYEYVEKFSQSDEDRGRAGRQAKKKKNFGKRRRRKRCENDIIIPKFGEYIGSRERAQRAIAVQFFSLFFLFCFCSPNNGTGVNKGSSSS